MCNAQMQVLMRWKLNNCTIDYIYSQVSVWQVGSFYNEKEPKYENNLKKEELPKNEDELKKEDGSKNEDSLKHEKCCKAEYAACKDPTKVIFH